MAFMILGVLLLAMKLAELGPVTAWAWWVVLAPFALAAAWWSLADGIGLTQRRAMDNMEKTKVERRNRNLQALGMDPRRHGRSRRAGDLPPAGVGRRLAKDPTIADAADPLGRR